MDTIVGSVRPSQLLWTYGPGAMIDLPNLSVMTLGTHKWNWSNCEEIEESRLLREVQQILGNQVDALRRPPLPDENVVLGNPQLENKGVPVINYPRFFRCMKCGTVGSVDKDHFVIEDKKNRFSPQSKIKCIHKTCEKKGISEAVPARFLVACRHGHIDDFPWRWFVHGGPTNCTGNLKFHGRGAALQTQQLWVKCEECKSSKPLSMAFGKDNQIKYLPKCRGRHPHLGTFDNCSENARTVLLGATNTWFPIQKSVLAIPMHGNSLAQIIDDNWKILSDITSIEQTKLIIPILLNAGKLQGIESFDDDSIFTAIERKRSGDDRKVVHFSDLKSPEWEVLTKPDPPTDFPHFLSEKTDVPEKFSSLLEEVLLMKRLREVNALIGFTRVEAPEETLDPDERPPMAPICKGEPEWVPANEVHGEGIFMKFNENILSEWENSEEVKEREKMLIAGYKGWRDARKLDPEKGFPGVRFAMLHTLSHLLIREMALECGYNAASIRERIYSTNENSVMGGILLYTAAADSDGTLGGLVELGKKHNLENILSKALERATICSSDPLCFEHDPAKDRTLHSAACHACSFVGETSCEFGNQFLDRSLIVKTFDDNNAAFFKDF